MPQIRFILLCCVMLSVGCRRSAPVVDVPTLDPRVLAGTWRLELRSNNGPPLRSVLRIPEPEPFMFGDLDLTLVSDTTDGIVVPRNTLEGEFLAHLPQWDGDTVAVKLRMSAKVSTGNRIAMTLTLPGRCPCQTKEFDGTFADGEVNGRFAETRGKLTSRGVFRLRRR